MLFVPMKHTRIPCFLLSLWASILSLDGAELPEARWTMYYITQVGPSQAADKGVKQTVTTREGKRISYHLKPKESRDARREAAAYVIDEEGKARVAAQTSVGSWKILPEGIVGLGNRSNPLVPWVHVAADQNRYPYGSRIHMPRAVGYVTPDGKTLDGYFYVGDMGYGVNGDHFDLFVGFDKVFSRMMERGVKQQFATRVDLLPAPRMGLDPLQPQGLAAILKQAGYSLDEADAKKLPTLKSFKILPRDNSVTQALVAWQKTEKGIPVEEWGSPAGAVTLWHLHALAGKTHERPDPVPPPHP